MLFRSGTLFHSVTVILHGTVFHSGTVILHGTVFHSGTVILYRYLQKVSGINKLNNQTRTGNDEYQ